MTDRHAVVDLARERRVRGLVDDLRGMLAADPHLDARTRAMLSGTLPCPALEATMPRDSVNDASVNLRLPTAVLRRVEALQTALVEQDPMLRAVGNVTQAAVLRLALVWGLDALEAKYPPSDSPAE